MGTCSLCKTNSADKKGSHIIPHFLIKSAVNEDGSKERDKKISFSFSKEGFPEHYFGNSVLPEKIEEVLGRALTEEEISKSTNHYTLNNVFCTPCEKRLGNIESWFSTQVFGKLAKETFTDYKDTKGNKIKEFKGESSWLITLFIYSVIWRCTEFNFNGFQMSHNTKETLRKAIDENLSFEKNSLVKNETNVQLLNKHSYILSYSITSDGLDTTTNTIYLSKGNIPYCIYINEISVQFFEKVDHVKHPQHYFLGISRMIDFHNSISLLKDDEVKIARLDNTKREKIVKIVFDDMADGFALSKTNFLKTYF